MAETESEWWVFAEHNSKRLQLGFSTEWIMRHEKKAESGLTQDFGLTHLSEEVPLY